MNLSERMVHNVEMVSALSESASTISEIIGNSLHRPTKKLAESYTGLLLQISSQVTRMSTRLQDMQGIVQDLGVLISLVNLAGRQRMLSQRALRFHLLHYAEPSQSDIWLREIANCDAEFRSAIGILHASHLNTDTIRNMVQASLQTWQYFLQSLQSSPLPERLSWNETLLQQLELLVQTYSSMISTLDPSVTEPHSA